MPRIPGRNGDGLQDFSSEDRVVNGINSACILATSTIPVDYVNGSLQFARVMHDHMVRGNTLGHAYRVCDGHNERRELRPLLLGLVSTIPTKAHTCWRPVGKA